MDPHIENHDVTGVILAGGRSSRMGRDKATLEVNGIPLFTRMLQTMQSVFPNVLISGDRDDLAQPDVPCYPDIYPGSALGGIYTGLSAAETPYIFVAPCDMPYPDSDLMQIISSHRKECDVAILKTFKGVEPCFAVYSKECLLPMKQALERCKFKIYEIFSQVRVCHLDAEEIYSGWEASLQNVNTPEEYEMLKERHK